MADITYKKGRGGVYIFNKGGIYFTLTEAEMAQMDGLIHCIYEELAEDEG